MTIHQKALSAAASEPARVAITDGPSGAQLTGGELADQAAAVTGALRARGFGPGDVLALWAPNVPAWSPVALGAMAAGGAVSPIGPAAAPREVAHAVGASGANLLITVPAFAATAREAVSCEVLEIGPGLLAAAPAEPVAVDPQAPALMPFSSGTTGTPKAITLTHANLLAAIADLQAAIRFAPADRVLALAPFAHIMGSVITLLGPLLAGATAVTMPRFDVDGFLEILERRRITVCAVPPPVMRVLAFDPRVERHDLSAVEVIACGGAPLAPALQEAVQRRFPDVRIGQGYGMTETACIITVPDREHGTSPGCVGPVSPGTEMRIVDGELHVRGPHVIGDGWLRTGDLAEVTDGGELKIVGRVKELIKVSGYQVAPAELEALMLEFPGLEDAAVIGTPDEERGEAVVAFVVGAVDVDALAAWLGERVAGYKRPREFHVVQTLPRTPSGKLLRGVLAEELRAVAV